MTDSLETWISSLSVEQLEFELTQRRLQVDADATVMRERLLNHVQSTREQEDRTDPRISTTRDSGMSSMNLTGLGEALDVITNQPLTRVTWEDSSILNLHTVYSTPRSAATSLTHATGAFPSTYPYLSLAASTQNAPSAHYSTAAATQQAPTTANAQAISLSPTAHAYAPNTTHHTGAIPRVYPPNTSPNFSRQDQFSPNAHQPANHLARPTMINSHPELTRRHERASRRNTYFQSTMNRPSQNVDDLLEWEEERENLNFGMRYEDPVPDRASRNYHTHSQIQNNHVTFPNHATSFGPTRPPRYNNHASSVRNIYEMMRKWNLRFSGSKTEDLETFLSRIDEGRALVTVTDDELLACIPLFLTGVAHNWFRSRRQPWYSWSKFVDACRVRFGDPDYQFELRQEIHTRTQGENEPVADFLTCLRTMFGRLDPMLSEEEEISYAHRNMLPRLHLTIHRSDIINLDHLEQLAIRVEKSYRVAKLYKPPPAPERSLLPDLAYRDPRRTPRVRENTINMLEATEKAAEEHVDHLFATYAQNQNNKKSANKKAPAKDSKPPPKANLPVPASMNNPKNPNAEVMNPFLALASTNSSGPPSKNPRINKELHCWNCHQDGHRFRDCKEPLGIFCYKCGTPEVTLRTCPKCAGNASGRH